MVHVSVPIWSWIGHRTGQRRVYIHYIFICIRAELSPTFQPPYHEAAPMQCTRQNTHYSLHLNLILTHSIFSLLPETTTEPPVRILTFHSLAQTLTHTHTQPPFHPQAHRSSSSSRRRHCDSIHTLRCTTYSDIHAKTPPNPQSKQPKPDPKRPLCPNPSLKRLKTPCSPPFPPLPVLPYQKPALGPLSKRK